MLHDELTGSARGKVVVNLYKLKGSFFNASAERTGWPLFHIMLAAKNARAQRARFEIISPPERIAGRNRATDSEADESALEEEDREATGRS